MFQPAFVAPCQWLPKLLRERGGTVGIGGKTVGMGLNKSFFKSLVLSSYDDGNGRMGNY